MKFNRFFSLHIIFSLALAIIGIILMAIGGNLCNNIGSVLLVSGIYTIIDNMFMKESLVDLVIQKIKLDKSINNSGLVKVGSVISEINYAELFEKAKSNIDIVHNYARTWTTNNYDFIKDTLSKKKCHLRVVLLNPESPFISALAKHYGYEDAELVKFINEAADKWKQLAQEVKGKQKGTVSLYFFNGQPTNSLYRIDNRIVVVNAKNSKGKSSYLPYSIYQRMNGNSCLYEVYLSEIEAIVDEAIKVTT